MIDLVISGGQTGVDQGGLRAARACGIPTGGWVPRGWWTEAGPAPWLEGWGLQEHASADYGDRTDANARDADVTIWMGPVGIDGFGFGRTGKACKAARKPFVRVDRDRPIRTPDQLADEIRREGWRTINVAGSRESKAPRIGEWAERFLTRVFQILAEG